MNKKSDENNEKSYENYEIKTTFGGKAPLTADDIQAAEEKAAEKKIAVKREVVFPRKETIDEAVSREKQEAKRAALKYGKFDPPA